MSRGGTGGDGGGWGGAPARLRICLALAFGEIGRHKGRSVLSVLGVVLGITAMASMMALSAAVREMTTHFMSGINGPAAFQVSTHVPGRDPLHPVVRTRGVTLDDLPLLRTRCPAVDGALPLWRSYGADVRRNGRKLEEWCALVGADETFLPAAGARALVGRGLAQSDVDDRLRVAVLGPFIRTNLFAEGEACVGQRIEAGGAVYRVVGAVTNTDDLTDWLVPRAVIVPVTAMPPGAAGRGGLELAAWAASPECLGAATQQVRNVLLAAHGAEDFAIETNEEMVAQVRKFERLFMFVFGGVAAIALIVAAVNIMSVTLVSLNRRVREIGVHKAVGAGAGDLFAQFIVESLVLSTAGGLLGLGLANASVRLMNRLLDQAQAHLVLRVSPATALIGLGFCVAVGFVAGLYPAIRAARMDPVEALRQES